MRSRALASFAVVVVAFVTVACAASSPPSEAPEGRSPRSVAPMLEQAERMRARRDFDAAIELYREAFERTPWNERIAVSLAATHAERAGVAWNEGRLPAAERDLREARRLSPDDPNVTRNLAQVLLARAAHELDAEAAGALRDEAQALAPDLAATTAPVDALLERRLDLAFELIERGQTEAGLERLEALHAERPDEPEVARLLAQAHVRHAAALSARENFEGAGRSLDRAAALYTSAFPRCEPPGCFPEDVRTAHWNRVVAWLNADRPGPASHALADAEARGFTFPDLRRAIQARP